MTNSCIAVARLLTAALLTVLAGSSVAQQAYPSKPIRVIVPFPPGGSSDPIGRMTAQKLAEKWGQPVLVENRPGGNGIIGTEAAAKSPADGYTMLVIGPGHVITSQLVRTPYDPLKDFTAVATAVKTVYALVLHPSVPANTVQEFIALARARPGQLNFASSGIGIGPHMGGELFKLVTGVKMQHIPYKGSGPAVADLIGGQVQLSFVVPISVVGHIRSGKLKMLAVAGPTRLAALPQVPTFAEAGLPAYDMTGWTGVIAPAGTSKEIVDKISNEIAAIVLMPEIRDYLVNQGDIPFSTSPEQFAALMKAEFAKYARIIKEANIKMEQ